MTNKFNFSYFCNQVFFLFIFPKTAILFSGKPHISMSHVSKCVLLWKTNNISTVKQLKITMTLLLKVTIFLKSEIHNIVSSSIKIYFSSFWERGERRWMAWKQKQFLLAVIPSVFSHIFISEYKHENFISFKLNFKIISLPNLVEAFKGKFVESRLQASMFLFSSLFLVGINRSIAEFIFNIY